MEPRGGRSRVAGLLGKARIRVPKGLAECLVGVGSLGDAGTREAFVHAVRSVLDPAGTTLEVFEQSGHFPHLTEPTRLADLLGRWVRETPAVQLDPSPLTARIRQPA